MAKIDSLPKFVGGSEAVAHISKSGTSQKIKLSQLIYALGHILTAGDVTMRPNKAYPDVLLCDGSTYDASEYPALAAKLNSGDTFNVPNIPSSISNISYYIKT
ncbi:phage tail protein [Pseudomonas asiatica]|uniref:phage tail protein n=1 Tax=Pseudomonas asiatica TaxID=2219225 RepID=UPI0010C09923|nr:phage tail protein [Pseudomonas asiatica]